MKNSTFGPAKKAFYILCCEGLGKDAGERNGQDLRGGGLDHIGKSLCRNAQAFLHKQGGDALFCFDVMQWFGLIYWFRSERLADQSKTRPDRCGWHPDR